MIVGLFGRTRGSDRPRPRSSSCGTSPIERIDRSDRSRCFRRRKRLRQRRRDSLPTSRRITLYHLERVARIDGIWTESGDQIADAIIRSSLIGAELEVRRSGRWRLGQGRNRTRTPDRSGPTEATDLMFADGEIVALVGDSSGTGKTISCGN
ncbi:MAG: hypothetical protein MZU97_11055 [Bacillus subtilis]|nr:hypothetical protein [Bacillus subtilis]